MSYTSLTGGLIVCVHCGSTSFHLHQTETESPFVFHTLCMACGKEGTSVEFINTLPAPDGTDDPVE